MRCYGLALGAALVVLGASSGACAQPAVVPPPPELSQEAKDEAKRLYEEGQKAVDLSQWEKARDRFSKAWRIRQIWQIAASLGQAEFKTRRYRDAAEHLTFVFKEAQAELASPEAQPERKRLEDMREKAMAKVGRLNITVNPAGAEVLVGGQVVGKAPLVVFVEPGLVLVEVRREGYAAAREERTAVAGQEERVELVLAKGTHSSIVPPTSRPISKPASGWRGPDKSVLIGLGTAAAAALAVGVGFAVGSNMKSARSHALEATGVTCPAPDVLCGGQFESLQRDKASFAGVSMWSFIGAGALAAGAGIYAAVKLGSKPRGEIRADVAVGMDRVGAVLTAPW